MCGITGFVGLDDERLLQEMCARIYHRGPDEDGIYTAPGVGLAMRRLAIIDLKSGRQPISNETQDIWVVFNGEIYNYQTLRDDLIGLGHRFKTTSDTETIVHLYEEYGLDFVQHLRGMFGIAIWDTRQKRLVLARDRIGEKPLYYARQDNRLYFGSEIKAILPALGSRRVNPQAVCDFLAMGYVAGEYTFYREIDRLPPGHMLIWRDGRPEIRRYWRNDFDHQQKLSFNDAREQLEGQLEEAVRLCLKSDVEVGAFLSGGIDSSVLVALMRQQEAQVQTFSVGYRGDAEGFNELSYAKQVADSLGTQHHELILGAHSSMELLPRIIGHYDEPHGEPTSVLVYLLCEFTRQRVKVALGGTGGDELFYGYPRHAGLRYLDYYHRVPRIVREQLIERVINALPESTQGNRLAKRARRFVRGAALPAPQAYLSWVSLLQQDVREGLFSGSVKQAVANPLGDAMLRAYLTEGTSAASLYRRVTALDVEGYLAEYQLAYMDRMSMAHSLEVRSPLCDYRLVEFATSLPVDYRLHGTRTKHILKEVARKWLPDRIIDRRKVGFDSPIGQWFKTELRVFLQQFLSPEHINRSGLLDAGQVQTLMADHLAGRRDYSLQLWSIIALETWYRMYIEGNATDGDTYRTSDLRGATQLAGN